MSSPNNSPAGLEGILIPFSKAFNHLLNSWPLPSCMVSDFLLVIALSHPGSRKYFLKAPSWFSSEIPNDTPENISDLILPSKKLCKILDGYLQEAVQEGMNSVQHLVKIGVFTVMDSSCLEMGKCIGKKAKGIEDLY